ncbi:MAG: circularly permuted type 2 ATP-grasp protein [Roseinatronobacter sp.]
MCPLGPLPKLLHGYTPQPGVADELLTPDGQMRPVWAPFIRALDALTPDDIAARFARGEQYLRDAGVYFRLYSGGPAQERDWPLSHVPVMIAQAEWDSICAGLSQRAEVLERIVADLYGPARLVADGHLPAELVAQSPHWLRPMVGITPRGGHWLHHLAFEIGRSPDGSFLVLGDRTQAPSGSGFALENRMATTRIFADGFNRANLHRLAGFFRAFRDTMDRLAGDGRGMALLTPGPNTDTYYEHTYIARYLGMLLVEGGDLAIRDGQVMVRTIAGLEPLGLLWRRIDSEFIDPLELDEGSQIGTPGLIDALRQGSITMMNAPGSGVLETRAFMAFFPRICETLLGEPLSLPNIATWWCGQPLERAYVQENAARMMIGAALDTALPFAIGTDTALGGQFRGTAPGPLADWIAAQAGRLVAQEAVTLSTTPAWDDGRLVPRPMTIRVIATRTENGWSFMPGGYARIGRSDDATALAMQAGGSVADVWVLAPAPVPADTLVKSGGAERAAPGVLPARAADNLYWLGRYTERTEGAIRLLRAWHLRLAETEADDPRMEHQAAYLTALGLTPDKPIPDALLDLIARASGAAARVRDRFSPDGWNALADLERSARKLAAKVQPGGDAAAALSVLLRKISGFSGLIHENMYHVAGWRFLSLGRAQERADSTLALLSTFSAPDAPPGALDIAVEVGDSLLTHQRLFRFAPSRASVLELLLQDAQNPRAVLYQIERMRGHVAELPRPAQGLTDLDRTLLILDTDLRAARIDAITPKMLLDLRARLGAAFGHISMQFFR